MSESLLSTSAFQKKTGNRLTKNVYNEQKNESFVNGRFFSIEKKHFTVHSKTPCESYSWLVVYKKRNAGQLIIRRNELGAIGHEKL
jgi:hypothetical protein